MLFITYHISVVKNRNEWGACWPIRPLHINNMTVWSWSEDGHTGKIPGGLPLWWPAPWKHTAICLSRCPGYKAHNYVRVHCDYTEVWITRQLAFYSLLVQLMELTHLPKWEWNWFFFSPFSVWQVLKWLCMWGDRTRKKREEKKTADGASSCSLQPWRTD